MGAPRPFGELLRESFSLFKAGLAEYAAIVGAALVPSTLLWWGCLVLTGYSDPERFKAALADFEMGPLLPVFLTALAVKAINAVAFMALVLAVASRASGQALGAGQAYRAAGPWVVPFLLTEIRAVLYILAGFIAFIIPGVILSIRYCFVHLAVLLEGRTGSDALARSRDVMAGQWSRVMMSLFGVIVVLAVIQLGLSFVVGGLVGGPAALMGAQSSFLEQQAAGAAREFLNGVTGVLAIAATVLLFKDLTASPEPALGFGPTGP